MSAEWVVLGKLGTAYGIRGWLKVHSYTDQAEGIFAYDNWLVGNEQHRQPMQVEQWRRHNKGLIVKLSNCDDRNTAERLINQDIAVAAEQLPALDNDEFYWRDLIGMRVINTEGYDFGVVTGLMETGSNDVLQVKSDRNDAYGQQERLIPFIENDVIQGVNLEEQRIDVIWNPAF